MPTPNSINYPLYMNTRSNHYYNDRGLKIFKKDADDQMFFTKVADANALPRNSRNQLCVVYEADIMDMPDDTNLVVYVRSEGTLFFIEKWKLYFLEDVNMVKEDGEMKLYVPYKTFKSIGSGFEWIEVDASNVTWQSIKKHVTPEEKPKNLSDQSSHFQNVLREAAKRA